MSKVVVRQSSIEGLGGFAATDIPQGEVVLEIDDSRAISEDNPLRLQDGEAERHCDYLAKGKVALMQSPERYINHSCQPNSYTKTTGKVREVLALHGIRPGDEITFDYAINGFGNTVWECNCGSARCRGTIHSDFFHLPVELQLEYLPLLDGWYVEEHRDRVEKLRYMCDMSKSQPLGTAPHRPRLQKAGEK